MNSTVETRMQQAQRTQQAIQRAIDATREEWGDEPRPRARAELAARLQRCESLASELHVAVHLRRAATKALDLLASVRKEAQRALEYLEAELEHAPEQPTLQAVSRGAIEAAIRELRDDGWGSSPSGPVIAAYASACSTRSRRAD
jgi:hypothetical protein